MNEAPLSRVEVEAMLARERAQILAEVEAMIARAIRPSATRTLRPVSSDIATLDWLRDSIRLRRISADEALRRLDSLGLFVVPADLGPELAALLAVEMREDDLRDVAPAAAWSELRRCEHAKAQAREAEEREKRRQREQAQREAEEKAERDQRERRTAFERMNNRNRI